ncbi:MAG: hypothetical protein GX034_05140 [Clostridiaceae bacterium]|jgi:hypothetical protein|nr:hypothetical protein [Clostridiaceae bacterium]
MLFKGRYGRAMKWLKDRRGEGKRVADESELEHIVEKGDIFAMIVSALIVIIPVALVFLLALALIGYAFVACGA